MAKRSPEVFLLSVFLQAQLTAAGFTVEEPKLPYDLDIRIHGENKTGHLFLSNRKLIDREWKETIEFDSAKKADIAVVVKFATTVSKEGRVAENSLMLKTAGGHPILISISPNLDTTQFSYEALADSKTPLSELFELLLQAFAKGTHFSSFSTDWLDTFSTSNAMLEAVIAAGKQIQLCTIEYGSQSPSLDLITRFVNAVKPSMFRLTIGKGQEIEDIIEPRLQLSDSFFESPVVRNLSQLQLEWFDTELSDESLSQLKADELSMKGVPKLTGKGLLQWLKPVFAGDVQGKSIVVSSYSAQTLLDGLTPLVDYTVEKGGESWTITGIKNGTRIHPTSLKITYYTNRLDEALALFVAERGYSKDYYKGSSRSTFALAILCISAVFFRSVFF